MPTTDKPTRGGQVDAPFSSCEKAFPYQRVEVIGNVKPFAPLDQTLFTRHMQAHQSSPLAPPSAPNLMVRVHDFATHPTTQRMPIALLFGGVTLGAFAFVFAPAATSRLLLRLAQVPSSRLYDPGARPAAARGACDACWDGPTRAPKLRAEPRTLI